MKLITMLLFAISVAIAPSCSKGGRDNSPASVSEALPDNEVVDIVNAVVSKDISKVTDLLKTNPKLIKARLKSGGPVDGSPLLIIATQQGDKPLVEVLLVAGADVNDRNYSDETALHYATLRGFKVQVLPT